MAVPRRTPLNGPDSHPRGREVTPRERRQEGLGGGRASRRVGCQRNPDGGGERGWLDGPDTALDDAGPRVEIRADRRSEGTFRRRKRGRRRVLVTGRCTSCARTVFEIDEERGAPGADQDMRWREVSVDDPRDVQDRQRLEQRSCRAETVPFGGDREADPFDDVEGEAREARTWYRPIDRRHADDAESADRRHDGARRRPKDRRLTFETCECGLGIVVAADHFDDAAIALLSIERIVRRRAPAKGPRTKNSEPIEDFATDERVTPGPLGRVVFGQRKTPPPGPGLNCFFRFFRSPFTNGPSTGAMFCGMSASHSPPSIASRGVPSALKSA